MSNSIIQRYCRLCLCSLVLILLTFLAITEDSKTTLREIALRVVAFYMFFIYLSK